MNYAFAPLRPVTSSSDEGKVSLVDATAKQVASPTNQDILNAINELHKKISELSKNQQILETKLSNVNWNVAHGAILAANYAAGAAFCISGELEDILQDLQAIQKGWALPCLGFSSPSSYFHPAPHWK